MKSSKTAFITDFAAIQELFQSGQQRSLRAVHAAMLETYLEIGAILSRKIREEGWGDQEIHKLSEWLIHNTGSGHTFAASNLEYMLHFHEAWSGQEEWLPLLPELTWSSHQVLLNECKSDEQRRHYLAAAVNGRWTRQELEERIRGGRS